MRKQPHLKATTAQGRPMHKGGDKSNKRLRNQVKTVLKMGGFDFKH